jgi:ComF family protein
MHSVLRGLLDLLLPPTCLGCDGLIATGDERRLVCRRCRTLLRPAPPPVCERCGAPRLLTGRATDRESCQECSAWPMEVRSARSAFLMHPPADRLVHQIKYRGWSALASVMAEAMANAWKGCASASDITSVTPVPTTASRQRERGYNQAELLARAAARLLGYECELLLERTESSGTQTTLQPAARGANVAGAFQLSSRAHKRVPGAHILVVDDVLTTGATTLECTQTLLAGGARCTSVLTFARAFDTRRLLAD